MRTAEMVCHYCLCDSIVHRGCLVHNASVVSRHEPHIDRGVAQSLPAACLAGRQVCYGAHDGGRITA